MKLHREEGAEPREIATVAPGLVRVPLRTPTLPPATRTNAWLVESGAGWWVVDAAAGEREGLERLRGAIDALPDGEASLCGYVFTHHHPDHVGGIAHLGEALPKRPVWVHERLPALLPAPLAERLRAQPLHLAGDEAELPGGLRLVHTPGHASDHLVVWRGSSGELLAGDVMAGLGTILINPPDGDMGAYVATLERLIALAPRRAFPAHGPHSDAPVERLRDYLAHRMVREEKVLAALGAAGVAGVAESGGRAPLPAAVAAGDGATLEAITAQAWDDVPPLLLPLATRSALAHLQKLEREGRVVREGARWVAGRPGEW